MMRKRKLDREAEEAQDKPAFAGQPDAVTEMIDTSAKLVDPAPSRPPAPKAPPPTVDIPTPKSWRVKNGGRILSKGGITELKPGKVVDERNYDIEQLRIQGIELEEVT